MSEKLDLSTTKNPKLFFSFAIPSCIGMILTSLYTIADGIFISRGVDPQGLAAVNIGYPIINFTAALSLMIGVGGATLISFKKGNLLYQNRCFSHLILLNILIYLCVATVVFMFPNTLLKAMGANDDILPMVKGYIYPCTIAVFFLMMTTSLSIIVRNDGAPKRAMFANALGAILNIILDYIFIFHLSLGIRGGAFATGISQIISAIFLCSYFLKSTFKFTFSLKTLDLKLIRRLFIIGFPSFILEFAVAVITVVLNIAFMNNAGIFGASAYGIVSYSFMFFRMVFTGLSQGIQPIVAFCHGKNLKARIKETVIFAQIFSLLVSFICIILAALGGKLIGKMYTSDMALIKESAKGMLLYSAALSFLSFNFINISFLQSIDRPVLSNMICISRSLLFVCIGVIFLPKLIGINGIWLTLPFADFVTAFLSMIFFKTFKRSN